MLFEPPEIVPLLVSALMIPLFTIASPERSETEPVLEIEKSHNVIELL